MLRCRGTQYFIVRIVMLCFEDTYLLSWTVRQEGSHYLFTCMTYYVYVYDISHMVY